MGTLLNLTPMETAQQTAELYVGYNGKDYRMTVATLLALVTKTSLGLDKINNTADLDKPISIRTTQALAAKADKDSVPSIEAFNAVVTSIQGFVSLDTLNASIKTVTDALVNYSTKAELAAKIEQALLPVNQALTALAQSTDARFATVNTTLTSLSSSVANAASQSYVTQAVAASESRTGQAITGLSNSTNESLSTMSTRLNSINQTLSAFSTALDAKAAKAHMHTASNIEDLEAFVTSLISSTGGEIRLGLLEW